jgi:hypothetical protein
MHEVISRRAAMLPGLRAEARRQGDGWLYLIDRRTPNPQGRVPPEDVVGVFRVSGGDLVPGSYQRNPKHLILSSNGFVQLGTELQSCLIEEIAV